MGLRIGHCAGPELIGRLEKTDFVSRRPDNEEGRIKRVFLTKRGQALTARIRCVSATEKEILRKIEESDLRATVRALRGIKENLLDLIEDSAEDVDAFNAA